MTFASTVLQERIVPVARGLDATTAPDLVEALGAGGIHSICGLFLK